MKDLKFDTPDTKVNSDEKSDVFAFEQYDKIIFHQLFDVCIPEVNGGEISKEKKELLDKLEYHLISCSCDLQEKL